MSPAKNLMALCNYGPDRQGKDLFFYIRQGIRLPHHCRGHDANRQPGCKNKRVVGAGEPFLLIIQADILAIQSPGTGQKAACNYQYNDLKTLYLRLRYS